MTQSQRSEVMDLMVFYDARGWDWSQIVEFLIRRFHGSLPSQEYAMRWSRVRP